MHHIHRVILALMGIAALIGAIRLAPECKSAALAGVFAISECHLNPQVAQQSPHCQLTLC